MPTDHRESLRLDACAEGDIVHIAHSPNGSWKTLGRVRILKIKPLAKHGRVQIKFRTDNDAATVRKIELDGGLQVQRIDLAKEVARAKHAGVTYVAPQGGDPKEILAEALDAEVLLLPGNGSAGLVALLHGMAMVTERTRLSPAKTGSSRAPD